MLGMLGMHGTHAANIAMQRCDLLIAVGVRFSDRALGNAETFAAQAKVLHIDIDRAEINKNVSTTLHITGDARVVLELLLAARGARRANEQWMRQARSMMEEYLSDELFEPRKILRQMAGDCAGDHRCDGRRPASDVDGAAFPVPASAPAHHQRRSGHDGLRLGRGDGRGGERSRGQAGRAGHGRRLVSA